MPFNMWPVSKRRLDYNQEVAERVQADPGTIGNGAARMMSFSDAPDQGTSGIRMMALRRDPKHSYDGFYWRLMRIRERNEIRAREIQEEHEDEPAHV